MGDTDAHDMHGIELVGHRGCPDHGPENTVRALVAAADRLPAVEFDLRRCGSGELVVFHDERVDDITDGAGRVADLDLATLRDCRVEGSDEPVATFSEVLAEVPESVTLQVELKESGLWADARALLADHDHPVRLSSFSAPALAEIARSDWEPATGLLFGEYHEANLDLAAVLGCASVQPHADLCLDTDIVDRAHAAGFRVLAWGLADAETIPALADRGVDAVTTDTWDVPGV